MFILWVLVITGITITVLHWQFKFCKSGQTFKASIIAVPYSIFAFQFFENHKLVFIILFVYVSNALWGMVIGSMAIKKQWAMEPKEEPYHN